jgi:soluble lytic murein transglycosylase-like protein
MILVKSAVASVLTVLTALGPLPPATFPAPDGTAVLAVSAPAAYRRSIEPRDFHDPAWLTGASDATETTMTASATLAAPLASPATDAEDAVPALTPRTLVTIATSAPDQIASSGQPRDGGYPPAVERWRPLVTEYFPAGWTDWALQIISCESHGDPKAVNARTGARGLMQHLDRYWAGRAEAAGWAGASSYDPEANIAVGAWLLANGGISHWSCRAPHP